ncbi:MAG TPA: hypothetical protein VMS88_03105 [Terriglobales bacterium]|nr:hypothetical protein [Terriglobales bacterium]
MAGVLVVAMMLVVGCGKSSSPTSPGGGTVGGGGGGGGGNTPFDSGTLNAPANFSHTFPAVGAVGYHCNFHVSLGMVGTVNVDSTSANTSAVVTAAGTSFTPATVTIKPGGTVTWNVTQGTHTVTSN